MALLVITTLLRVALLAVREGNFVQQAVSITSLRHEDECLDIRYRTVKRNGSESISHLY
jgi:hypothetical protein